MREITVYTFTFTIQDYSEKFTNNELCVLLKCFRSIWENTEVVVEDIGGILQILETFLGQEKSFRTGIKSKVIGDTLTLVHQHLPQELTVKAISFKSPFVAQSIHCRLHWII